MQTIDLVSGSLSRSAQVQKPTVASPKGVVVAQNRAAAEIGAEAMRRGGTAIDAVVATGMALGVVEPWMSGLAGGGALLVREPDGSVWGVDFGMVAPGDLDPADYPVVGGADADLFGWPKVAEDRNVMGASAVAVPGMVDGLAVAHARGGRRPWAELLEPAVALAKRGMEVDWFTFQVIAVAAQELERFADTARLFLPGGRPAQPPVGVSGPGRRFLPMPALAGTLRALASEGPRSFYEGGLARRIVGELRAAGSRISEEDLATYHARVIEPERSAHGSWEVLTVPGLNGGPTLQRALGLLRARGVASTADEPALFVAYAEALLQAWEERLTSLGAGRRADPPDGSTTHVCAVDSEGRVVTHTQTLLSLFGSRLLLPDTGLLMNNGIMWFDPTPGRANSLAPGRRPLANLCPALLRRGDEAVALGGAGGRKIIPAVMQIASFLIDRELDLDEALQRPRIDVSGLRRIVADRRLSKATLQALAAVKETAVADRTTLPTHFTIASAAAWTGKRAEGVSEPHHPWADAVAAG